MEDSMNEAIKNMLDRRSIRKYEDRPLEKEDLETILDCAIHAPTAMNRQARRFTVLTDAEQIQEFAAIMGKAMGRDDYDLYHAPCLIIVSVPKDLANGAVDTGCAMENILLAAHAVGVGACWINQLKDLYDEENVREALNKFDIPADHMAWAMATLGYPAEEPSPKERTETIHYVEA